MMGGETDVMIPTMSSERPPAITGRRWLILIAAWVLTAIASLPPVFHWAAPPPRISRTTLALELAYVAAALILYWIYRVERKTLRPAQALALVFMVFLVTSFVNELHNLNVDKVSLFNYTTNEGWQQELQKNVINLLPAVAPHSYRFLPNGIVRWLELCHVRFAVARDIYRLIAGLLLFYALYRYARFFTSYAGGLLAMLLAAVVYPITFSQYAGQLTDPLSHLSFVLAFIFLETEDYPFLLTTLLVGSLAKETVLALAGYYVLFCRKQRHYAIKAIVLCAASLGSYFGVRMFVLHGMMQYGQISGVSSHQMLDNLKDPTWRILMLVTVCSYIPFLVFSWKQTPVSLKKMSCYLLPVLLLSSLFFSWLRETRNYVPAIFVLAVVTGRFLSRIGEPAAEERAQAHREQQSEAR